jgi:hypothetical protein
MLRSFDFRRSVLVTLVLPLFHAVVAPQAAAADESLQNPLAAATSEGTGVAPWAGRYTTANGAVQVTLEPHSGRLMGRLSLASPAGPQHFAMRVEERGEALVGNFGSTAVQFPLELRRGKGRTLVLRSGPHRHELKLIVDSAGAAGTPGAVVFNGLVLDPTIRQALETAIGGPIPAGSYWYDPACGAVGLRGGPVLGFLAPNLQLGGKLAPDASGGTTRVFVNTRELHPADVTKLTPLVGRVLPGRYWLDAQGNYGLEGSPAVGNLVKAAHQIASTKSGDQAPYTIYKDFGGRNGKTNFGSFGNGDFFFSSGSTSWWPGK